MRTVCHDGMIYQIGKYIGMMGAVLEGNVDAVLLAGRHFPGCNI